MTVYVTETPGVFYFYVIINTIELIELNWWDFIDASNTTRIVKTLSKKRAVISNESESQAFRIMEGKLKQPGNLPYDPSGI